MVTGDLDILNSENENTLNISDSRKDLQQLIQKEIAYQLYSLDIVKRIELIEKDYKTILNKYEDLKFDHKQLVEQINEQNLNQKMLLQTDSLVNTLNKEFNGYSYNNKSTKSATSDYMQINKNLCEKVYGAFSQNQIANTFRTLVQSNSHLTDFPNLQDTQKLENINDCIKNSQSPFNDRIRKSREQKIISYMQTKNSVDLSKQQSRKNTINQSLSQNNFGEGLMFRSLQTFSALSNNSCQIDSKFQSKVVHTQVAAKKSPIVQKETALIKSQKMASRDNSYNPTKPTFSNQIAFKKESQRQNKQKVLSMNTNTLGQICKELKKDKVQKDVSQSLAKYQMNALKHSVGVQQQNANKTNNSSSQNSNFAVYKNHSMNHKQSNERSDMNENDNTTPFNFSSEQSKINYLSHDDTKVQPSQNDHISNGQMKMGELLQKPSVQTISYNYSPELRRTNDPILVQQSSQSMKTIRLNSPQSQSPTTKKSNISTLEENNIDLQSKSIGQSLTERLNIISNDKKNKFSNAANATAIQSIIFNIKKKEQKCICKKKDSSDESAQSSRRQSRMQYGVQSTLVTPSRDESHSMIQQEDGIDFMKQILPCSDYCQKLEPEKQKEIIKDLMRKDYGPDLKLFTNRGDEGFPNERKFIIEAKWWNRWCDYTGFEMIQSQQDEKSIDLQIVSEHRLYESIDQDDSKSVRTTSLVFQIEKDKPQNKQNSSKSSVRYNDRYNKGKRNTSNIQKSKGNSIIQLLDYEKKELKHSQNLEMLREEMNRRKKPLLNETQKSINNLKDQLASSRERGTSEQNKIQEIEYQHPGKMKNLRLIDESTSPTKNSIENTSISLKSNLMEHHDYEAVSTDIWKYISSWYKFDIPITRYLIFDSKTQKTMLDLYPKQPF